MFKKGRPPLLKAALLGAKPGIAADVARTGMLLNVPFPAVQSPSFAVGVDRLPHGPALTIICAPVRHQGEVVAVVQCYNKTAPGVPAPEARFTEVDEILLGILAHHCGAVLHNCALHAHAMAVAERALNAIHLTRHYPCAAGDLFAIAWVFLSKVLLPPPHAARTDCPPTRAPGPGAGPLPGGADVRRRQACNLINAPPPPPAPSRTNWTRLVPPSVLTGHVSGVQPHQCLALRPADSLAEPRRREQGARRPAPPAVPAERRPPGAEPRAASRGRRSGPQRPTATGRGRWCPSTAGSPVGSARTARRWPYATRPETRASTRQSTALRARGTAARTMRRRRRARACSRCRW